MANRILKQWSLNEEDLQKEYKKHENFVYDVASNRAGVSDFASVDEDGILNVWNKGNR